ncbi:MAG: hypothetical protein ACXU7G_07380 [Croceibacterium sp.]
MSRWMPSALAATMLAVAVSPTPAAAKAACDRDCLLKLTDAYVASFAKHSLAGVPLKSTAAIVENVTPIKAGEGLWKTVQSGPTPFQVHVPDPVNETAGWLGMMQVDGKPTMVAIRLKLDKDGKIVEAEHLYATVNEPMLKNVEKLRPGLASDVPAANRKSHDDLIKIGQSYYDALDDNDGTKMPFAADCERHENGMVTAGPNAGGPPGGQPQPHPTPHDCTGQISSGVFQYIKMIGNRRVFAADPVTGLVMGLSQFHHPMDFTSYPTKAEDGTTVQTRRDEGMFKSLKPFDLPAAHIFKVGADGKVHEIEAMGFLAPLNAPSGWENEPAPANRNAPASPAGPSQK